MLCSHRFVYFRLDQFSGGRSQPLQPRASTFPDWAIGDRRRWSGVIKHAFFAEKSACAQKRWQGLTREIQAWLRWPGFQFIMFQSLGYGHRMCRLYNCGGANLGSRPCRMMATHEILDSPTRPTDVCYSILISFFFREFISMADNLSIALCRFSSVNGLKKPALCMGFFIVLSPVSNVMI